jgi:para-nitrobenzyl esterase
MSGRKGLLSNRLMNRRNFLERCAFTTGTAALVSISLPGLQSRAASADSEPVVETSLGKVRGALVDGVYVFKGLRYAAPTGGENRFMPPQDAEPWAGIQEALTFGNSAPQTNPKSPIAGLPSRIILSQLPHPGGGAPAASRPKESEDCLFLNVWTSGLNDGRKRPVMLWLHGGFFAGGSGSSDDSMHLAKRGDVVNVTVNHRLNIFGYSHFGDLGGAEFAHSGNAGMLDIIAALKWVHGNIDRFGGDPSRIMVFGVSGGGMKTAFLMASPPASGLLHRAGVESGPGLKMMDRDQATKVSEMVLQELGLKASQLNELKTLPVETLLAARSAVEARIPTGNFTDLTSFAPVIDPEILPHHPFYPQASPLTKDIPLLIGSNQSDMVFFMGDDEAAFSLDEAQLNVRLKRFLGDRAVPALKAYRTDYPNYSPSDLYIQIWSDYSIAEATIKEAERKAALKGAPVYLYRFDWRTPVLGGKLRSLHSLETPFVFNNTEGAKALTGGGPDAEVLAARMSEAWVSFATTGDPNSQKSGLPSWPAYRPDKRATMLFDNVSIVANDPARGARVVLGKVLDRI